MRPAMQFLAGIAMVLVPAVPVLLLLRPGSTGPNVPPDGATAPFAAVAPAGGSVAVPAHEPPPAMVPPGPGEAAAPAAPAPSPEAPEPGTSLGDDETTDTDASGLASDPPPDPGRDDAPGTCSVSLRFTDAESGQPLAVHADLWRLGIPETRELTPGDALRAELEPFDGPRLLTGLPAGRYRIACVLQRAEAADPPEFVVSEQATEAVIALRMPRKFAARLLAFDETGAPLRRGALGSGFGCSPSTSEEHPEWAQVRRRKDGRDTLRRWGSAGVGCRSPQDPGPVVEAGEAGFPLGSFSESSRAWAANADPFLTADGRARIVCRVSGRTGLDRTFVGVAPILASLLDGVRRPDGSIVAPSDATVSAWCRAVPYEVGTPIPTNAWRTAQVRVRVRVEGFQRLEFVWTADTAQEQHVLDPEP